MGGDEGCRGGGTSDEGNEGHESHEGDEEGHEGNESDEGNEGDEEGHEGDEGNEGHEGDEEVKLASKTMHCLPMKKLQEMLSRECRCGFLYGVRRIVGVLSFRRAGGFCSLEMW